MKYEVVELVAHHRPAHRSAEVNGDRGVTPVCACTAGNLLFEGWAQVEVEELGCLEGDAAGAYFVARESFLFQEQDLSASAS